MTRAITLPFGMHKGKTLAQISDIGYIRWLAQGDQPRTVPARGKRPAKTYPAMDAKLVAAAKARLTELEAAQTIAERGKALLAGVPFEGSGPVYLIECDGDMHSASGTFAFDLTIHPSLDAALALITAEYPLERDEDLDDDMVNIRQTPDPEDDRILIWEVLPSGHRKVVWQFAGWHHSADEFAVGQCALPGDDTDLYTLAMRDY